MCWCRAPADECEEHKVGLQPEECVQRTWSANSSTSVFVALCTHQNHYVRVQQKDGGCSGHATAWGRVQDALRQRQVGAHLQVHTRNSKIMSVRILESRSHTK